MAAMRVTAVFLVVVAAAGSGSGDDSKPPVLPADVQAVLKTNASLFSSVLITGKRSRRFLAPAETVLKQFQTNETEADFTNTLHFELRFKGARFRESREYPHGNSYVHDLLSEISFDGIEYRIGDKEIKDTSNSLVTIFTPGIATEVGKLRNRADSFARMQFWYLRETGFTGPQTLLALGQPVVSTISSAADHGEIVAVKRAGGGDGTMLEIIIEQPEPWQSRETFDIETHPAFVQLLNGTDKLQMRLERERRQLAEKPRVIRFLLDRTLGYAVREKWESRKESGETMFHTKNSDFVQVTPDGVWMPKRCVVESYAYDTAPLLIAPEPLYETVIQMDQCEPGDFDDDQFRIWYDIPGVSVVDYTSPKATVENPDRYRVPAAVDDSPKERSTSGRTGLLITLNVLLIAVWIGWLYSRSRKKSTKV
jgi:hypothetical protein